MGNIKLLDCTLRDGGWVNDFCFGNKVMKSIVRSIENSGIEYVELGYLDAGKGSAGERSEYSDMKAACRNLLKEGKKSRITYLAMIDYGKYPVDQLPACSETTIDGIRLCFHKKDADKAIEMGRKILEKGYLLMMQPMVCTRYTESEFKKLILQIGEILKGVSAVYLVDSFGAMSPEDIKTRMKIADSLLGEGVSLGLHAHNNMRMAFQNAVTVLNIGIKRTIIIDGTLAEIGKGAGNIATEEFAVYLNQKYGKSYDIKVLKAAARELEASMQPEYTWGYHEEYYLAAKYCLTPGYVRMFCSEYKMQIEEADTLLSLIPDEKKDSFDRITAENVLNKYMKEKRGSGVI